MLGLSIKFPSDFVTRVEWLALSAGLAYCTFSVFTGPLRWLFGMVGLTPLSYLPQMLMLLSILLLNITLIRDGFSPMHFIAWVIIGFAVVVGAMHVPSKQVIFGLYTLLPFWYGLAAGDVLLKHWKQLQKVAWLLWSLAVLGVFLNNVTAFPWEGFSYSVGDVEIVSSKEWENMGGGKRLAGFSRASFDAALQILLLGLLVCLAVKSIPLRLIFWGLSFGGIYLTTSKGVYNMFFALTPLVLIGSILPASTIRWWPLGFGIIGVLFPMAPLVFDVDFYIRDQALANLTFSFWDRLNDMWPRAWELLHVRGNWLFGRGFGGIGTPQSYFEPELVNAADNLFMYWFVILGWIALPGFLLLLLRSLRMNPWRDPAEAGAFGMLLATIVYGVTANVVESGMFAIASGIGVRSLFCLPFTSTTKDML